MTCNEKHSNWDLSVDFCIDAEARKNLKGKYAFAM